MHIEELGFKYPEELIATEPNGDFRTMMVPVVGKPEEITKQQIFDQFNEGDVLVINDSQVVKRRVFSDSGLEVLFIRETDKNIWEVLFPASRIKDNQQVNLPEGISFQLVKRGIPQTVEVTAALTDSYFEKHGELALPPYIQKARSERHNLDKDDCWYQTDWGTQKGSCASPTASLHFDNSDLEVLKNKGVSVQKVTLHVGIGTFLPIRTNEIDEHEMHKEWAEISCKVQQVIETAKSNGCKVWALGTTATRVLESWKMNLLSSDKDGNLAGMTGLFIRPGFEFQVVDYLMTNFHQPQSTLLALVMAFTDKQKVVDAYQWAMDKKFRLFSYGDLSIWTK